MKTFNRKTPKAPSRFAQFIRFTMLGICVGCGVMILKLATFSQIAMYLAFQLQVNHWLTSILVQLFEWSDALLLAPLTAYVAGRIFLSNKWKFVVSMFVGIQIFPIAIIFADGAGISLIELGFRIAIVVFGMALSIFTFGCGVRAAMAQEQLPPGASPKAPQPLPQPLSQIDFTAVSNSKVIPEASPLTPSEQPTGAQPVLEPPAPSDVESPAQTIEPASPGTDGSAEQAS